MAAARRDSPLRSPLGVTVLALLAIAFLALLWTNYTTYRLIGQTAEMNEQVERTYQVKEAASELLAAGLDAEAGQRGFLLTGRVAYLSIRDQAVTRTPGLLDKLDRLTRERPEQNERVKRLRGLFQQRFAIIQETIDLYRAGNLDQARDLMTDGASLRLATDIRITLRQLDQVETTLLRKRTRLSSDGTRQTVTANVVGGALILIAAIICLVLFTRYIGEIQASRRELDRVNRGLEETVLERTEDLLRANDELAVAKDRAEALLREVNHRVGNSLQLVSSMISLQSKALPDKAAREALRAAQARIEAVAQVHRRLYTSANVGHVALDDYLQGLIDELRQSLPAGFRSQIDLKADPLEADTDRAVSLGVVAAELITNAVKYAYRGKPGPIRVRLLADGEGHALLMVEDDGVGMDGGPAKGTGLGAKILKAMATSLQSKVDYEVREKGVRAMLRFELPQD